MAGWRYFVFGMFSNLGEYMKVYRLFPSLFVWIFGSSSVWHTQMRVLSESTTDEAARAYASSIQQECNMTGISGAIVAQIAVTAMALQFLSQTHWIARAFWVFSFVLATMAVFYSRSLQCIMGRLLCCSQVRVWIRGAADTKKNREREKAIAELLRAAADTKKNCEHEQAMKECFGDSVPDFKTFCPAIASVIALSAPSMLLTASLIALLVGFGVYLGFVWRRDLDTAAGSNGNRDVFIVYIAGVFLCFAVYVFSSIIKNDEHGHGNDLLYPCLDDHPLSYLLKDKGWSSRHGYRRSFPCPDAEVQRSSSWRKGCERSGQQNAEITGAHPMNSGHENLITALNNAAKLRRESAMADEYIAKLYGQYTQKSCDKGRTE